MSSSSVEPESIDLNDSAAANNEFQQWQLPDVTQTTNVDANLFGRYSSSEQETEHDEYIAPPTLADIEHLQKEAEAEAREQGFEQGKNEGLEKGRLDGLAQGHEEGFEQGKQQGLEQGLADSADLLTKLEKIVTQIEQPLSVIDTQVEACLLALSTNLAKAIVGSEIKTHPEHILSVLRQGVEALPVKKQEVVIRLHPDDANLVEQAYSAAQLERNQWIIESDPSLQAGDCFVSSQRSNVDMRLASRSEAVLAALLEQQHQLEKQLQTALSDEIEKASKLQSQDQGLLESNDEQSSSEPS
ncbi:flagellar assembly protein FliH [Parashewanella spongiae]|uniref:Flagellar assembly protein FliH n=1 Tax=Parashewanella spongiae TaxID=342950 RepID=A0A3A6U2B0_9GAMM|nr:flagellar assembly protein FliH [Parashewanella spongiae]MCL1076633.1 flagellar assembly protein FliH [Parashewanella spongiae]RJY19586.1 flagellar assembly protein FliH [Parashewanella spongiae]